MLKFRRLAVAASVACLCAAAASVAQADPVTGELHITGAFALSSAGIDFLPVGGSSGNFSVVHGTGSFASLIGSTGVVRDVAVGAEVQPSLLVFAADPALHFDSTALFPGVYGSASCFAPAAAGQTCSPPGVGANLTNLSATMSMLSIAGTGNFVHMSDSTPYFATLTTQFASMSYQSVLETIAAGGTVYSSYSVSLAPVPEPASYALILAGLAVVGTLARRRHGRS